MFEESLWLFCYSGLTLYVSSPVPGLQLVNGARLAADRSEKGLDRVAKGSNPNLSLLFPPPLLLRFVSLNGTFGTGHVLLARNDYSALGNERSLKFKCLNLMRLRFTQMKGETTFQ